MGVPYSAIRVDTGVFALQKVCTFIINHVFCLNNLVCVTGFTKLGLINTIINAYLEICF